MTFWLFFPLPSLKREVKLQRVKGTRAAKSHIGSSRDKDWGGKKWYLCHEKPKIERWRVRIRDRDWKDRICQLFSAKRIRIQTTTKKKTWRKKKDGRTRKKDGDKGEKEAEEVRGEACSLCGDPVFFCFVQYCSLLSSLSKRKGPLIRPSIVRYCLRTGSHK